jgi:peptide-methionine (S)-S-oxide reductase
MRYLNFFMTLFLICLASPSLANDLEDTNYKVSILAGGCFWCMEPPFERVDGVISVVSGYAGGHKKNPSYKDVTQGNTGHYEVVAITYDPDKVSYNTLLDIFWRNVDPFDHTGQFCDKGQQYKSAVFYDNEEEKKIAEKSKFEIESRFSKSIHTVVLPVSEFYQAEEYHQDYYKKNKFRYKFYRGGCGRDNRLEEIWGDEAGGYHILAND